MNLNEVEKHVKFDLIFNLLIYIGIGLCLILSIIVILATPAKAASNNINSNSHSTCGSSMGSGSYYGAFQNGTCYSRAIGTTYSGQASLVGFWLNYNFQAGKYYTITINFKDNDLLSSTIVDVVRVVDVANNRNEWSSSYNFISKKQFKVYFLAPNNTSSLAFSLASGSGDPITGVSNYGISSIYLEDNDNSDEIINANNQNTQNVINNNNANAEATQNAIFDSANSIIQEIATRCNNLVSPNQFNDCILENGNGNTNCSLSSTITSIDSTTGSISFTQSQDWAGISINNYIPVDSSLTYYLNFNINRPTFLVKIVYYNSNYSYISERDVYHINSIVLNNIPISTRYIKFHINVFGEITGSTNISNLTFNTTNGPFCAFGSSINKLDEIGGVLGGIGDNINITNDKLQDEYNYLTDDTNPVVDDNGIQNVISGVEIDNPLSYLLTLPLHLISKINQVFSAGTCSRVDLGAFGFASDYHFVLPCINFENYLGSSLWGTIDVFVSIGLLAFTLYKIYHAVANILTLGGEDEVTYHLGYLSPMEFLATIIGEGGFGSVVGKGKL